MTVDGMADQFTEFDSIQVYAQICNIPTETMLLKAL